MKKAKVAVLFTRPSTVLEDYARLFELAGADQALDPGATTILKDNVRRVPGKGDPGCSRLDSSLSISKI